MKPKSLPKINDKLVSLPSRVQNYYDAQQGVIDAPYLLPVSCSMFVLNNLEDSLKAALWIKRGAGVKVIIPATLPSVVAERGSGRIVIAQDSLLSEDMLRGETGILGALYAQIVEGDIPDFSLLRPKGSVCTSGLEASGAESFYEISDTLAEYQKSPTMQNLLVYLGTINKVMLQGGFKKGIITTSYPVYGERLEEYLDVDLGQIPGSLKIELRFPEEMPIESAIRYNSLPPTIKQKIINARNFSSMLLAKEKRDKDGNLIYTNVCEGIYLNPDSTCLIVRVPLGNLAVGEIVKAYKAAYKVAYDIWDYWHSAEDGKPLSPSNPYPFAKRDNDLQVAIDPVGLHNLLHREGIKYKDFINDLAKLNNNVRSHVSPVAREIYKAYRAVEVLNSKAEYPLQRVFTVEPSQAHAFRLTDAAGYTFARGIWAAWNDSVTRSSDHWGETTYHYPPGENALTIGSTVEESVMLQDELNIHWFKMMNKGGLAHAISADVYHEYSDGSMINWLMSDLPSQYYQFHSEVDQRYTAKQVETVDLSELDLSPVCDITAGYCEVCGA